MSMKKHDEVEQRDLLEKPALKMSQIKRLQSGSPQESRLVAGVPFKNVESKTSLSSLSLNHCDMRKGTQITVKSYGSLYNAIMTVRRANINDSVVAGDRVIDESSQNICEITWTSQEKQNS
ncbi:hypothetical protein U0070_013327 [Myodes glareolus]|uniref:Uncharacterized protein n=1 Tax=Myodes glareolus TaxID=447135 RepID=A0AAW0JU81_MYOGA